MYRGQPTYNPQNCKQCGGSGRQVVGSESWLCDNCNGTGIQGNGLGPIFFCLIAAFFWAGVIWYFSK